MRVREASSVDVAGYFVNRSGIGPAWWPNYGARVEKTVEGKLRTFLISKKLSGK